eukprot:5125627-Ditylum_brightwellii.AAC.1
MGMEMVLATAEMLNSYYVKQTMETTGANYNEGISALNEVIPNFNNISYQWEKALEMLKMDE